MESSHNQCGSSPLKTTPTPIQWQAIACIRTDPLGGVSCDHGLDGMLCVSTWSMLIRTMEDIVWVTPVHYNDVTISAMASQITSIAIIYSTVYWVADQWKHQSPASLAFVRGIHRWLVNSPHKRPVTRKMLPFDDVIMGNVLSVLVRYNFA